MVKVATLMKTFGWSKQYCLDELDGAEGNVWFNWAVSNEASVWGTGLKIDGLGYIGKERERIKQLKKKNG